MRNKFLEKVMMTRAEEQMRARPTSLVDYNKNLPRPTMCYDRHTCLLCLKVKPRGGLRVCSRCWSSNPGGARRVLKENGFER